VSRSLVLLHQTAALVSIVLLTGCAHFSWPEPAPAPQPAAVIPAVQPTEPPPPPPPPPAPWGVTTLLMQADMAFKRGRYTSPAEDNAFDRYKAVLVLDPDNAQALAGLDSVHLAYIDYARAVKASGNIPEATELVTRGATYFPQSPLLNELRLALKRAQATTAPREQQRGSSVALDGTRVLLPEAHLVKQTAEVKSLLVGLANRVRKSDESILIIARNDREGRWIYQVMQQAVSGYRIRGDIHLSRTPAIEFMPPL
jgi:hypothetical protein